MEVFMNNALKPADILVPKESVDMEKWAVIACDQYTSEPEYWNKTAEIVGNNYSSLNMILPEIYLEDSDVSDKMCIRDRLRTDIIFFIINAVFRNVKVNIIFGNGSV